MHANDAGQGHLATTTAANCDALEHCALEAKATHEAALASSDKVECGRTTPQTLECAAPAHTAQEYTTANPPLDDDTSDTTVDDNIRPFDVHGDQAYKDALSA